MTTTRTPKMLPTHTTAASTPTPSPVAGSVLGSRDGVTDGGGEPVALLVAVLDGVRVIVLLQLSEAVADGVLVVELEGVELTDGVHDAVGDNVGVTVGRAV